MSPAVFIFLWSNCGEYLSSHESGQKKQNGAQNRFEFAPYLFILPKLWLWNNRRFFRHVTLRWQL